MKSLKIFRLLLKGLLLYSRKGHLSILVMWLSRWTFCVFLMFSACSEVCVILIIRFNNVQNRRPDVQPHFINWRNIKGPFTHISVTYQCHVCLLRALMSVRERKKHWMMHSHISGVVTCYESLVSSVPVLWNLISLPLIFFSVSWMSDKMLCMINALSLFFHASWTHFLFFSLCSVSSSSSRIMAIIANSMSENSAILEITDAA